MSEAAARKTGAGPSEITDAGLVIAPLHKRAMGMAVGLVLGALVFLVTLVTTFFPADQQWPLELLSQYFAGYTVSWPGAFVGLLWGGFVGFVAGWFAAFCRNFGVGLQIWLGKTKEELRATRDFLDHI
jgi:hypothetical protein